MQCLTVACRYFPYCHWSCIKACLLQGASYKKAEIVSGRAGDFKSRFEQGPDGSAARVAEERRAREEKGRQDRAREAAVCVIGGFFPGGRQIV